MQGCTFAMFHWLLHRVLLYLVTHVHKPDSHRHKQTYTEGGSGLPCLFSKIHISEIIPSNSLLAKTLCSRPLVVQLVKMWCELKAHCRFCSLRRTPWGLARRKWREDSFLAVHYLHCPLHKVKLGHCLSFNKQLNVNLQEVFFWCDFNPQLSHNITDMGK